MGARAKDGPAPGTPSAHGRQPYDRPATDNSAPPRQGIQSVELAMTVLQALEEGRGPMSLTQIATASGTQPSKAHRYLVSLARAGLVVRSPGSGRYDLGPAMRRLGVESLRRMDEVALVSEHLPGLRDRTTHAVNLSGWGDHGPVVVRWEYGARALPITVRSGATMPLLNSAMGGAFLTHLPEQLTDPVLRSQLEEGPLTEATRTRVTEIRTEPPREGVAATVGGVIPGVPPSRPPVFTAGDSLPLVVTLVMPSRGLTDTTLTELGEELRETARTMSEQLGHASPAQ
ncbi:IclR family transcriptional regulator [Streptomyces sp. WA1-19]|nr:IclR family transcriptional regulator [Streptomyces sp. WA1-19]UDF10823.1 IclR family transcriptional regulator [Streptomyces sp. WA1-19]